VIGLVIAGFVGTVLAAYATDRVLKARSQTRRLRAMRDRLTAATARADEQQGQRQAAAQASAALTSVMPAIERPPLTLPGVPTQGAARPRAGGEHTGPQDRRSAHPRAAKGESRGPSSGGPRGGSPAASGRRLPHTGQRPAVTRGARDENHRGTSYDRP
jgi:hypothetical protein